MRKMRRYLYTLLLFSMLFIVGCGNNSNVKNAENKNEQVSKIRILSPANYLPFTIAEKKGFFKEAFGDDITVEYAVADSGSVVMETMTAGDVEFAALGDMPVIQAKANGLDVKIISSFFTSTTGYQLVAAKDSGIKKIEDIKGKRVAVMSGSTNHKLFLKYLESVNLTENDVNVVFLKNKDQLASFVANSVDAAVTSVPTSTKIVKETGAYEVQNAEGYDTIVTVIAGNNAFLKEHPEYAKKFLEAIKKATKWIEDNKKEAFEICAEFTGDTYENTELYYNTRTFKYSLDDEIKKGLEDTISYLFKQNTIKQKLDVNELLDKTYINDLEE